MLGLISESRDGHGNMLVHNIFLCASDRWTQIKLYFSNMKIIPHILLAVQNVDCPDR